MNYATLKRLLLVLVVSMIPIFGTASADDLVSLCRTERSRNLCIRALLSYRCTQYQGLDFNRARLVSCQQAARALPKLLDLASAPRSEGKLEEVVFRTDLLRFIQANKTTIFLNKLLEKVEYSVAASETFRLWDETVHLTGNVEEALKIIAVLFQDATETPAHLAYLRTLNLGDRARKNTQLLEEILTYFSLEALKQLGGIKIYPMEFQNELNPTFYHFYIMAYLSKKLLASGTTPEMSFFLPFLFNTQYELSSFSGWPLRDPGKESKISDWKAREIFAGYLGAMSGIKRQGKALSYSEFKRMLSSKGSFNLLREMYQAPLLTK